MVLLQAGMRSIWTHGGCVSSSLVSNISVILLKREAGPVHLFWGVWNSEKISIASQNCVPITLDNPQTSLSTLSIWTTFYWRNSFSENGWHSVLWLIQSSWGTVSGKRYFIEIFKAIFLLLLFFVFFFASPTNKIPSASTVFGKKAEIPEGDIYLWQPEQIKSKFSAWLNWYGSGSV